MTIREVENRDAAGILKILNHYISNTNFLLDLEPFSLTQIEERIDNIKPHYPFLVGEYENQIIGFAHGYPYNAKAGYKTTAGTTIYLDPKHHGKGYGYRLYNGLISSLPLFDIKVAIGGITAGNKTSIAIHKKLGFRKVAHFEKVAFKFDEWLDVEYWQKEV